MFNRKAPQLPNSGVSERLPRRFKGEGQRLAWNARHERPDEPPKPQRQTDQRTCRPPSNEVSRKMRAISSASCGATIRAPIDNTLASLWARAMRAV